MEKRVLIVDDDEPVRTMLKESFSDMGFSPEVAETGEEALVILERENIQVMFFDLKLPGMNGLELCRKVRANQPFAVIHAMTGYSSLFELSDCREAGFDDYFIKPVNLNLFIKAAEFAFEKLDRWQAKSPAS